MVAGSGPASGIGAWHIVTSGRGRVNQYFTESQTETLPEKAGQMIAAKEAAIEAAQESGGDTKIGMAAAATRTVWTWFSTFMEGSGLIQGPQAPRVLAFVCMLPAFLGLYKSEYTVSYGYGVAMAASGWAVLNVLGGMGLHPLAKAQALCFLAYGVRLSAFLIHREVTNKYFQAMVTTIEKKAPPSRLKRLPFILGCGALYLGMAAPMVLTARYAHLMAEGALLTKVAWACPLVMALGLVVAAVGDMQKTAAKSKKGSDALVDTGLYALMRHPNYTGEQVLWSASAALGVMSGMVAPAACLPWLLGTALGAAGINYVLFKATTNLERKQEEKYGSTEQYRVWVDTTFGGFHGHTPKPRPADFDPDTEETAKAADKGTAA